MAVPPPPIEEPAEAEPLKYQVNSYRLLCFTLLFQNGIFFSQNLIFVLVSNMELEGLNPQGGKQEVR